MNGHTSFEVLCKTALRVFHVFLLKVALSKVLDPHVEMNGKSGAGFFRFDMHFFSRKAAALVAGVTAKPYPIFTSPRVWFCDTKIVAKLHPGYSLVYVSCSQTIPRVWIG